MSDGLKACPFCGYSANLSEIPTGADSHYLYFVECTKCPATIDMENTKDKIIKAWNTRADPKQEKYQELIMAVERKHPNETRHETALRFITEAENGCCNEGVCENNQEINQ